MIDRGKYHMGRWLREIHRVLAVGGRLEYIFFDKALYILQPLTAEMEPFLYEECPGCRPHDYGNVPCYSVTGTEFLELLAVEGFESVKTTVLMFPMLTMSALFTHERDKREGQPAATEHRGWWDDSKTVEEGETTVDTTQVLKQIHRECTASGTAWKCTVGWAEKSSMIRYAKGGRFRIILSHIILHRLYYQKEASGDNWNCSLNTNRCIICVRQYDSHTSTRP